MSKTVYMACLDLDRRRCLVVGGQSPLLLKNRARFGRETRAG